MYGLGRAAHSPGSREPLMHYFAAALRAREIIDQRLPTQ